MPPSLESVEFRITKVRFTGTGDFRIVAGQAPDAKAVVAKGNFGEVRVGDIVTAEGTWQVDPQWGQQFVALNVSTLPNNKAGFIGWAEARLTWLGEARATELWTRYGSAIWDKLKAGDAEALTSIRGITPARAQEILEAYRQHAAEAQQVRPLMEYGFGLADAKNIVQTFGGLSAKMLEEDPYRALQAGVRFDEIDRLTRNHGMAPSDWRRVHGMTVDILGKHARATGDTRADREVLKLALRAANNDKRAFFDALSRGGSVLPAGRGFVGLKKLVLAEQRIAKFMGADESELSSWTDMEDYDA